MSRIRTVAGTKGVTMTEPQAQPPSRPQVGHRVITKRRVIDGIAREDRGEITRLEDGGYCVVKWDSDGESTSVVMMSLRPEPQAQTQRRLCSKCGEDLGFSESDPCSKCEVDAQPQEAELKPCPFCPHGYGFIRNESGRYNGVVWIECDWPSHAVRLVGAKDAVPPCGARTAEYQTEQEAINAWNTRAGLPRATVDAKWDKSGLKEACQRALEIGRTHQEIDIQLMLDMLLEIERLESTPRAEGELTVEAALKDLREMFPQAEWIEAGLYWDDENGRVYEVEIGDFDPTKDRTIKRTFQCGTLHDCVNHIRTWAKSRDKGEKS